MRAAVLAKGVRVQTYDIAKRCMDIGLSLSALIALSPVLLVVAITIKLTSKGPVLFVQKRIGKLGKPFDLYKFRSMMVDAENQLASLLDKNERDGPVFKMKDDPRVTLMGSFIRKHSIDELPQLFNILAGDMSLVGPRPNTVEEVAHYHAWHKNRLQVTPGLTCYWQVHPNRDMSFDDWVSLDLEYIENRSFTEDVKLILKTIPIIFTGH